MPDRAMVNHGGVTVTDMARRPLWHGQVFGIAQLMEDTHPDSNGDVIVLGKRDWSTCGGLHSHPANPNHSFSETRTGLDHVSSQVPDRSDLDTWQA